jgi:hypothetical protein
MRREGDREGSGARSAKKVGDLRHRGASCLLMNCGTGA